MKNGRRYLRGFAWLLNGIALCGFLIAYIQLLPFIGIASFTIRHGQLMPEGVILTTLVAAMTPVFLIMYGEGLIYTVLTRSIWARVINYGMLHGSVIAFLLLYTADLMLGNWVTMSFFRFMLETPFPMAGIWVMLFGLVSVLVAFFVPLLPGESRQPLFNKT